MFSKVKNFVRLEKVFSVVMLLIFCSSIYVAYDEKNALFLSGCLVSVLGILIPAYIRNDSNEDSGSFPE